MTLGNNGPSPSEGHRASLTILTWAVGSMLPVALSDFRRFRGRERSMTQVLLIPDRVHGTSHPLETGI